MFRIKTDIRHYRCDSREKVEKLIRNWVIRPADLLLDPSSESWAPIGDHPSFAPLFSTLEEAHKNTPDTVVTTPQSTPPSPSDEEKAPPAINRLKRESMPTPALGVLRPARSARKLNPDPTPDALNGQAPDDFPAPPEPPEGVVDPVRDSGEITMMTERTLELLSADDDSARADTPSAEHASDDGADEASPDEATVDVPLRRLGRHDLPEDLFATAELSKPELDEIPRIDDLAELDGASDPNDDELAGPDEVTALHELPPLSEEDEDEDASLDETSETRARWNISLNSPPEETQNENENQNVNEHEDDNDPEDVNEHEDVNDPEDDNDPEDVNENEDVNDPEDDNDPEDVNENEDDLDPDENLIVAQAISPELELDEDALDQAIDDLEDAATAARERDDDDLNEVPVEKAKRQQNLNFVSSGYAMELPIAVVPSRALLDAGIVRSPLSQAERDRRLPRPAPKKSGYRMTHTFDLSPPPPPASPMERIPGGASALIALALVIVIIALIVAIF